MLVTRRNQDFMPTLFNELMNWNDTTYSTPRMNIMETKDNYQREQEREEREQGRDALPASRVLGRTFPPDRDVA